VKPNALLRERYNTHESASASQAVSTRLRSAAALGAFAALTTIAQAGFAILSARALGPSGRGTLAILQTVQGLVWLVGYAGIPFALRVLAPAGELGIPKRRIYGYLVILSLVQVLIGLPLAAVVLTSADASTTTALYLTFGFALASTGLAMTLPALLFGFGRPVHAGALSVVGATCQLLLGLALYMRESSTPAAFLASMGIAMLVQLIIGTAWIRASTAPPPTRDRPVTELRQLASTGLRFLPIWLGLNLIVAFDRLLVGVIAGTQEAGIYSAAGSLAALAALLPLGMSQLLVQESAEGTKHQDLVRSALVSVLPVVPVTVLLLAIGPWLLVQLTSAAFAGGSTALRILSIAAIPYAFMQLALAMLAGRQATAAADRALFVGLGLQLLIDIPAISVWGMNGAAVGSLCSYSLAAVLGWQAALHQERTRPPLA
jgi:O-antigen/teichoic acid export membrane protein